MLSDELGGRKRLFGLIEKVEEQPDGTIRVFGIASSEEEDDQQEIVRASAMRAAIPDYMRYPALREMHQLSAAGTTLEADVGDDGVTRLVARVVDPVAISKVRNRVYRGFSIGGRVTQREPGNPKCITGLVLNEISLVDRPANPAAILDTWKIADIEGDEGMPDGALATLADTDAGKALAKLTVPAQVWACGTAGHEHSAKAEAQACIEKRAAEGAVAAADELRKAEEAMNAEPEIEPAPAARAASEPSPTAKASDEPHLETGKPATVTKKAAKKALRKEVREFIKALSDVPDPSIGLSANIGSLSKAAKAKVIKIMSKMNKRIDAGHQMGLDIAAMASTRAMGAAAKKSDKKCAANMSKSVIDAGATDLGAGDREMLTNSNPEKGADEATNHATQDTGRNGQTTAPNPTGAVPSHAVPRMKSAAVAAIIDGQLSALTKSAAGAGMTPYQKLMMIAHDSIKSVTGGATCKADGEKPDYLTRSQMDDLDTAHYHFSKGRGLMCDAASMASKVGGEEKAEHAGKAEAAEGDAAKSGETGDLAKADLPAGLAKALDDQRAFFAAQSAEMVKTVAGIAEMQGVQMQTLEAVSKRVEDIAKQEMPPLTIAKGTVVTEKGGGREDGLSADELAAALAKMSPDERAVTSLKGTFIGGGDAELTKRFGGAAGVAAMRR